MSLVAYSDDSEEEEIRNECTGTYVSSTESSTSPIKKSDTVSLVPSSNLSSDLSSSVDVTTGKSSPVQNPDSISEGSVSRIEDVSCNMTGNLSPVEKPDSVPKETSDGLGKDTVMSGKDRSLFSSLPRPITFSSDIDLERKEEKSSTKVFKRQPVKISIPSLDYGTEENEDVPSKKPKVMPKGSRLFALLPPPKTVPTKEVKRQLVPNVLTKKAATASTFVKPQLDGEHKKLPRNTPHQADNSDSGDDSGEEGTVVKTEDYFSLSDINVPDEGYKNLEHTVEPRLSSGSSFENEVNVHSSETSSSSGSYHPPSQWTSFLPHENYEESTPPKDITGNVPATDVASTSGEQTVTVGDVALDEEAFKRLGGPKYKRQMQAVEVIDINEDTIMPDSNEWLTKQLTVETNTKIHGHSHRKNDGPTTQQRRKHQITYLAFQKPGLLSLSLFFW
ncbi:proline-rich protein PRCC isoform X2 [Anabrus simplex]|uniref:proline-rich protein PRCC isoform X2 n=1 Tax=Anabrus simplex TaxID=316456 RepID=UPI0035A3AE1E